VPPSSIVLALEPGAFAAASRLAPATSTCFPFRIGDPPCADRPGTVPESPWSQGVEVEQDSRMVDAIRRLGPADAAVWRALRLEALERHPDAFGASLEEEAALPLGGWTGRLESGCVFGAERSGELVGSAGLFVERTAKKRHKAVLWGVYVRREARGAGFGRRLVGTVIEAARDAASQLHTAVVTDNHEARSLYRQLGFIPYGIEPRALEVDGRFLDEELLVLDLGGHRLQGGPTDRGSGRCA
jgi:GNAT superfamily N-acetyltransferase